MGGCWWSLVRHRARNRRAVPVIPLFQYMIDGKHLIIFTTY